MQGLSGPVQSAPDYPDDVFLAKYDRHGNLQSANHAGGYKAIGNGAAVSPDGKVSVTGFIGNINYGDSARAKTIVTSQPPGANIDLGGGHFSTSYKPDELLATFGTHGVATSATRIGGSYRMRVAGSPMTRKATSMQRESLRERLSF